jgi:exodeoxyribonuclease V alpha subunit
VGDPDQLVSVEAGAVLADLVGDPASLVRTPQRAAALAGVVPHDTPGLSGEPSPGARLRDGIGMLTHTYRYAGKGPIDQVARAIRGGDADEVLQLLRGGGPSLELIEVGDDELVPAALLRPAVVEVARAVIEAAEAGDAAAALLALDRHRLLCAHRVGPRGVRHWEQEVQTWLLRDGLISPRRDGRYAGQPLLVTSNDYDNKLWNGDTGVVVAEGDGLVAYFSTGGEPVRVPLGRLGDVRPMHAMTVHRSQGSQFKAVTVLLPAATSPLGTRETLYTAVTRAEESVRVIASAEAVTAAVGHRVNRASGLQARLE